MLSLKVRPQVHVQRSIEWKWYTQFKAERQRHTHHDRPTLPPTDIADDYVDQIHITAQNQCTPPHFNRQLLASSSLCIDSEYIDAAHVQGSKSRAEQYRDIPFTQIVNERHTNHHKGK